NFRSHHRAVLRHIAAPSLPWGHFFLLRRSAEAQRRRKVRRLVPWWCSFALPIKCGQSPPQTPIIPPKRKWLVVAIGIMAELQFERSSLFPHPPLDQTQNRDGRAAADVDDAVHFLLQRRLDDVFREQVDRQVVAELLSPGHRKILGTRVDRAIELGN